MIKKDELENFAFTTYTEGKRGRGTGLEQRLEWIAKIHDLIKEKYIGSCGEQ